MFMPASSGTTTPKPDPSSSPSTSMLSRLLPLKHSRFDYVVDTLTENVPLAAKVVARVQYAVQSLQNSWVSLARGNETSHRVFAVALGYVVMSIFVLLYLGAAGANLGKLGRGLRKLVWQQWVIIKVAFFVLMEIIIFPLGCGLLVDFSLLPLFPDGQLESRIVFCNYSPMTCLFYHWTLGTSFMYQFAILLASCRSLMRKGAMWFIKDPGDPNFSPVREILERPVLTQLRKLTLSAIMYTAVIVGGVGGILFTVRSIKLQLFNPSLLPLNLSMREPLSQIPIDLLFIHIFLGPSLQYARPKRHLLNGLRVWWKHSAKFLRLTSYMYGTRQPAEEAYSEVGLVEQLLAKLRGTPITQKTVFQGGFLRVPNTDTGAFPTNKPALIRVDEEGHPITEAGAELMHIQDEATRKAGRDVDKDFMVVYVPPHLRYRVITFIVLFWLTGALTVILGLGVPIAVGRHIIQLCGTSPVHDGYTLIIGLYCVWGFVFVYRILFRIVKRRRYTTPQRLLLKLSAWLAASVYLVTMLGIVLPILLALVIDFYIILPIRLRLGTLDLPRIHVVESWAVGLLYAKIGIRLMRMEEANDISLALEAIMRDGLRRPQVWFATRYFILPVGGGMIGMICLPPAIMYAGQYFLPAWQQEQAAFRYGYPGVFFLACLAVLSRSLHMVIRRWFQAIRDTEYLLELRLTNLEKTANGDEPDDTQ
ncbi:hypothetical protein FRC02_002676 [Tulasnella sp. 418]|nr:hypothetical protein FRC02_002676 [Tulasnella sp. 418]